MHNSTHTKLPMLLLIVLGTMTAFGPVIMDMYLPTLPAIQQQLNTSTLSIQLTLSFAMIGLALGQLVFGPLSSVLGRKRIALIILNVLALASRSAVFITTFPTFLLIRLVQGLTAEDIIIIAKAFTGDYYQGNTLAKSLALLMIVNGIVTILVSLLGDLSLSLGSWKIIFVILAAVNIVMLSGVTFNIPATHHFEHVTSNFKHIFSDFGRLLGRPKFIIPTFLQRLTYVMLSSFSSASPFITQKIYHMTPRQFSVMIAINGIGLIVVNQIVALFVERIHRFRILIYLTFIQPIGILLIVFTLILQGPLWLLLVAFFLNVCPVTSIDPLGFSVAMEGRIGGSGSASSLLGLFQFTLGGLVPPSVGLRGQYNVMPYITVIVIVVVLIILLQFLYFKKYQRI